LFKCNAEFQVGRGPGGGERTALVAQGVRKRGNKSQNWVSSYGKEYNEISMGRAPSADERKCHERTRDKTWMNLLNEGVRISALGKR